MVLLPCGVDLAFMDLSDRRGFPLISALLTLCSVADMIKGKTPEQIREEFAIDDDFVTD